MAFTTLADLSNLFANGNIVPTVAIICGTTVGGLIVVSGIISGVRKTRQREQTKREIAAYIAEGSISPEDARVLLEAGKAED